MAIQIPNPGTGNGATGDNEFVLWSKVKDNFTDQTNAASRLVGTLRDNVPVFTINGIAGTGWGATSSESVATANLPDAKSSGVYATSPTTTNTPVSSYAALTHTKVGSNSGVQTYIAVTNRMYFRATSNAQVDGSGYPSWAEVYSTVNTTKEAATGYLVASSPVLKVQHDSFEKVHEAEQLDIDVQHVETGVYTITGTTGLRDNDGWYLKPPKDINGNVLCICEATQDGDVITLKTYKKKFDFETVSIVADYEQPADIPEGAEVMLRFNDLPAEPMPPEV